MIENLKSIKAYVEGQSVAILVKNTEDFDVLKKLVILKADH